MRRYRIIAPSFSGNWRATRELAKQDAIRAGLGSRDAVTGIASIDQLVRFEIENGDNEPSYFELLEGDALAILVVHSQDAEIFVRAQLAASMLADEKNRWSTILMRIEGLRREARIGRVR